MENDERLHWKHCLMSRKSSLKDVIVNLEKTGLQIVIIVSNKNSLEGIITDGDIRRGLIKGLTLDSLAEDVMSTRPIVADDDVDKRSALKLMKANLIHHLPKVNNENIIIDLFMFDEVNKIKDRDNTIVVMAGGFGKRLAPYTNDCPKPMLKVNNKPMLEHILEKAISEGFKNFIFSVFYLSDVIKKYFEDGSKWGVSISYIKEDTPLGTAGALSIINPIPNLPFIVTNGDVITNIKYKDILKFHEKQNAHATMAIRNHEWQNPFGEVLTDGIEIKKFEEKPIHVSYINAGVYVLQPEAIRLLNHNEICDMPTLFERISKSGKIIAYPMHESWVDVGRPEDLDLINKKV